MTVKEYIDSGGKYYQKLFMGYSLFEYIFEGKDLCGEPKEWAKEVAEDILNGKALVLCPKEITIQLDVTGQFPIVSWRVEVFYPKFKWKKIPKLKKHCRELSVKEIIKKKAEYEETKRPKFL